MGSLSTAVPNDRRAPQRADTVIGEALLVWALVYAGASLTAIVRSFGQNNAPARGTRSPLTTLLVRPCAGMEPALAKALRSSENGADQIIFAVASRKDGAFDVASRVARQIGEKARVDITHANSGNRKASQIAHALATSPPADVVVTGDSDVVLNHGDVAALVAALASEPTCVAVWAPPVERAAAETLGDLISQSILGASLHAFPLLAHIDHETMVGKLVAFRRGTLDAVGGFHAMVSILGEDMELGKRLRAHGQVIRSTSILACSHAERRSFEDVFQRYIRWASVIRTQRPTRLIGYPLLFCAWPLIAFFSLVDGSPFSIAGVALATVIRMLTAWRALVLTHANRRTALAAPLADGMLLVAFVVALWSRRIDWRGASLELNREGEIR